MNTYLSHVRYVEQCSFAFGTTPQMFFHDATVLAFVKYRELVPSEWDHISAEIWHSGDRRDSIYGDDYDGDEGNDWLS